MEQLPEETIGLDIRNSALTAVELVKEKDTFKVVNYSRVELEPGIIDEDAILLNPDAFKKSVLKLIQQGHEGVIKSTNVIISIPEEKTFSHYLSIPAQDADDYEGVMGYAKDLVPIELSEASIDYKRFGEQKKNKKSVDFNFVAVQQSIIQPLITTLQEAGLRVVAIDVDKNSLMRVCYACTVKNTSTMMIEVNHARSLLTVRNSCGLSHTLTLSMGESMFLENVKKDLNVNSTAEARALVQNALKSKDPSAQKIQARLKEFYDTLVNRAQELHMMIKSENCPLVEIFFIVELGPKWPGLKEFLKKAFPKAEMVDQFECGQVGQEDQRLYFNAIGLALRAILPEAHEADINLLPHIKKEEIHASEVRPKLRLGFAAVFLLVAGVLFYSGLTTARTYFDYLVSEKGRLTSIEKVSNPYLAQAAQANQQKAQLESQVNTILKDNLSASRIVKKINDYNLNEGISLVNVRYQLDMSGAMSLNIRAKTASREDTEKFILNLEQEPLFVEVHSPLSNLVGKGERFIQLDIDLDKTALDIEMDTDSNEEPVDDTAAPEGDDVETHGDASQDEEIIEEEPVSDDTAEPEGDAVEAEDLPPQEEEPSPEEEIPESLTP
ncbi:pilus assembly protein PilM [Patescibacteria group bacterium]|nr:pilus assembly protein PilM [Patescibacteria group bacterium]